VRTSLFLFKTSFKGENVSQTENTKSLTRGIGTANSQGTAVLMTVEPERKKKVETSLLETMRRAIITVTIDHHHHDCYCIAAVAATKMV
jgi:hypothetical protein